MPSADEINDGLAQIAANWRWLAALWHVYLALPALGLALGWRPPRAVAGVLLSLPLLSVSALAWTTANPFNGIFFVVAGVASLWIACRLGSKPVETAPRWLVAVGAALVAFGWVYPHFLDTGSFVTYLYAAPTGLIPCPTLAAAVGFTLALRGLDSAAWSGVLGVTGLFYGTLGTAWLGVAIDGFLLLGALLLLLVAVALFRSGSAHGG